MQNKKTIASTVANPPSDLDLGSDMRAPLVGAVVETVRMVDALVPFRLSTEDASEQVGMLTGLIMGVVTEQVRFTAPAKPPDGVSVIVDVLLLVAPADN